ncbi:cytochrome P450 2A9 [Trichonephila inaurata madagascariensis]|uniref:Cytochrome P450 2A9 n=1 Tax=Trichonephila inaurata madagascariensis TaxID=2747483 RepID=A0A8X6YY10_9ARAC|nr:cytochrome P450 2A9 [Trichonephila inaurata madagascariensis]GFY80157.1 cytochrome P450 2A9 [Trichonephila inaurata madagascariensis]
MNDLIAELERLVGVKCQLYADDLVLWTETPKYHAEAILSIALDILDHWCQDNMKNMLEGNLSVLFLGSSDTISSSLNYLLRLMCKYTEIQDKVYSEVIEAVGKDGKVRHEDKSKVPYTFAVMMEMQRFASIVRLSTTRKAVQDIPVRGYVIPKGADITANLWALHHDPEYWDKPDEFQPERFLTDDGTKLIKQLPSYAPFSVGKRNCPGETIAWMGILSYFTEIVKNFEISVAPGKKLEYKEVGSLVMRLEPQPLCFIPRNN